MSGMSQSEPRMGGLRRPVRGEKVDESKLQKLLDFIDHRMQNQRSKLKRQIEDTQQAAEDMEEKKHKATILLLKNYFEVTSGRVRTNQPSNSIHDERLLGTLSEPSMLPTVPEIDPDVLAKPRSMYDKIARRLDTSRLPMIAPAKRNLIAKSLYAPVSDSSKSTSNSDLSTNGVSTPMGPPTPAGTPEPMLWKSKRIPTTPPTPTDYDTQSDPFGYRSNYNEINAYLKRNHSPVPPNSKKAKPPNGCHQNVRTHTNNMHSTNSHTHNFDNQNGRSHHEQYENNNGRHYDGMKGHRDMYQKGNIKPSPSVYLDDEVPSSQLGDANVAMLRRMGVSRHTSLRRPMKSTMSMSTVSLADVQPTRKQRAASNLKHALKNLRVPR